MSENDNDLGFEIVDDPEEDSGMLFIFPDDNPPEDKNDNAGSKNDGDDEDSEGISLSFGKVSAKKKEEDLRFLPFLNIPEIVDEEDEEPSDFSGKKNDEGEAVSLSFGKVNAAKKEEDYVYLPFLKSEEEVAKDEQEEDESEDDSGIDIVGGDEMLNLTPLKTEGSGRRDSAFERETDLRTSGAGRKKTAGTSKKNARGAGAQQRKKTGQRQPQKPNKVQQILSAMDPDVLAAVSGDPRQMMLLEETVRSELIKQAAHNAVARELSSDAFEEFENQQKLKSMQQRDSRGQMPSGGRNQRPNPQSRRPQSGTNMMGGLSFAHADVPKNKSSMPIMDMSQTLSEFGEEAPQISQQPVIQQQSAPVPSPAAQPVVHAPVPQVQPVTAPAPAVAPVPAAVQAQASQNSTQQRKAYVSNSPAAIRAAMKAGMPIQDSTPSAPSAPSNNSVPKKAENNRHRELILKKPSENRSGCAIGVIIAIMAAFVALIVIISGKSACSNLESSGAFEQAETLYQNKQYSEALDVLRTITDYPKAGNLICDCYYKLGKEAEELGDTDKAIENYSMITSKEYTGYQDVVSSVKALTMKSAKQREDEEDYVGAGEKYNQFLNTYASNLSDAEVEDIKKARNECNYIYGKQLYDAGEYADAETYFKQLKADNYEDSAAYYARSLLNAGEAYYNNGQYSLAREKLSFVADGQDALTDVEYAKALCYYTISTHNVYKNSNMVVDSDMKTLLGQLEKAYGIAADEETKELIESAMSDYPYDKYKLVGKWKLDDNNYFEYTEDGFITINFTFNVMQDVKEGTFKVLSFEKGRLVAKNDDYSFMFDRVNFDPMTSTKPDVVAFANSYDHIAYNFYRSV